MPNIWLDVTTTMRWSRPPVGIVRVETEVFRHFASRNDPAVRFCQFDLKTLSYQEVKAAEVFELIHRFHRSKPAPTEPVSQPPTAKRAADKAKALAARLPAAVRHPMIGAARRTEPVLRRALHEYRLMAKSANTARLRVTDRLKRITEPPPPEAPVLPGPTPFEPGDVLISGGLDWDQKDRVYLYHLKLALGLKVILWCYDLIPVLFPHLCVSEVAGIFARYFVDVAWCADEVLCISKSSQRDFLKLVEETGAPEPRTSVVHLGANLPPKGQHAEVEPMVKGKYLLFVSTIERRKNHEVIYRALTQLVDQGRTDLPQIVFVGMQGWGVNDFMSDLRIDPRVRGRFTILNHVTDEQLANLYENALFTVYPSLYEGWGLPLAESLAHGKFCLSSNTSSLPEVGGALVEYLDPWDVRRWAERIAWYLDHPEVLTAKEREIRERFRPTTWADTGRTVYEAALKLVDQPWRTTA